MLQKMNIVAAKRNVDAVSYTLSVLQEAYNYIDMEEKNQNAETQKEGAVNGEN
jgi:hypothetical protein